VQNSARRQKGKKDINKETNRKSKNKKERREK
jgi:hypothetical protein